MPLCLSVLIIIMTGHTILRRIIHPDITHRHPATTDFRITVLMGAPIAGIVTVPVITGERGLPVKAPEISGCPANRGEYFTLSGI